MIDPSVIEEKIAAARERDSTIFNQLLGEVARLPVVEGLPTWDAVGVQQHRIVPGKSGSSGLPFDQVRAPPENGSFAYQLFSAIAFAIDARAELKLLELIASPTFYAGLMRSAAEQP